MKSDSKLPLVEPRFRRIKWIVVFLLPLAFAVILMIATVWFAESPAYSNPLCGCNAAGKLYLAPAQPSIWSLETALYPTIPLFASKLPTVRTVDIFWDLIAGRGYRGACTIVVYQVFRTVMANIMRTELLPHDQVLAMQYSTVSIPSLIAYIKSSVRAFRTCLSGSKGSVWTTSVLILATAYSFATPTWLSAMTGYRSATIPFLLTDHGLVSFDQITACQYVIVDGHRIALHDNFCVDGESKLGDDVRAYLDAGKVCYPDSNAYYWKPQPEDCDHPSVFYFLDGQAVTLPSPALTILEYPLMYQNHTLSGEHIAKFGQCIPQQDQYEWGFSFIILLSFTIATAMVASCVSILWYKYTDRRSPQQVDMMFGKLRTALVIGASVQDKIGEGMYEMTEKELNTNMTGSDGIGHVHARSDIMFRPRSDDESRSKSDYGFPVGSDGYAANIRKGLNSLDEKELSNE